MTRRVLQQVNEGAGTKRRIAPDGRISQVRLEGDGGHGPLADILGLAPSGRARVSPGPLAKRSSGPARETEAASA